MRYKKWLLAAGLLFFNINFLFAGGPDNPCGGSIDPDDPTPGNCPLDTWVILLVAGTLVLGYIYLKKQKKQLAIS